MPLISVGQRDDSLRSRVMERLDEDQAAGHMAAFRAQQLAENFCFRFQLEHKPRRGRTLRYKGVMYGSQSDKGLISRFSLFPAEVGSTTVGQSPVELIVHNGVSPKVWMRRQLSSPFVLIDGAALFEPVFEGVLYTPFDLQMPFVHWNNYDYEGPSRILSRIAQCFSMYPPENSLASLEGVTAVRVAIDDAYSALLQAEVLEADEQVRTRFTVRGLKKVQGHYIIKEIELKDMVSKDATTFKVNAASVGLDFDAAVFDPQHRGAAPEISAALFETL